MTQSSELRRAPMSHIGLLAPAQIAMHAYREAR